MSQEREAALLHWYRRHRRDLPWRNGTDPYRVLVSEVMLQQTQAARVVPYYVAFLRRFPTTAALADAPLGAVLEAWSGLGYNTRAVRLRNACRIVAADGWPTAAEALRRLPGVGPYTAAAVASIAFGERVAAVDTNVRRVLSRWMGEPLDGIALEEVAHNELARDAAEWNQAVMELGAQLCTPRAPACERCPTRAWCAGPDVYVAPAPQARFEGSRRQARGAVIEVLASGHRAGLAKLAKETGLEPERLQDALESLQRDGLITVSGARYAVAD